jgi:hypothetical protein
MEESYYRDRISAYKDHGLPPMEMEAVRRHLEECADCRRLLAELERLDQTVKEHSNLAGEEYWEQLAQRIENSLGDDEEKVIDVRPEKRRAGMYWKVAAIAASLAVLTFVGLHQKDILKEVTNGEPSSVTSEPSHEDELIERVAPQDSAVKLESRDETKQAISEKSIQEEKSPSIPDLSKPEEQPAIGIPKPVMQKSRGRAADEGKSAQEVAPTAAPPREDEIQTETNENYKATALKDLSSQAESLRTPISDNSRQTVSRPEVRAALQVAEETDSSLTAVRWEQRMDSLFALYEKEAKPAIRQPGGQGFTAQPERIATSAHDSLVENHLLEACFGVVKTSQDTSRVEKARLLLRKIAGRRQSPNQDIARQYLERLDQP